MQVSMNRVIGERKKFEADALSALDEVHELKGEIKIYDDKVGDF